MNRIIVASLVLILAFTPDAIAKVTPVEDGFQVSYGVRLGPGTSNGNDINDVMIFEWAEGGEFSADGPYTINGRGRTHLSHVVDFEPTHALVMGWGAAIPGVGDEKDHLFTLSNALFSFHASGQKWSDVFPGVPPEPRTGHNAMIGQLQAAAAGDADALGAIRTWIEREASTAAFDPDGGFRVIEWSIAQPIDDALPVPVMPLGAVLLLALGVLLVGRRYAGQAA